MFEVRYLSEPTISRHGARTTSSSAEVEAKAKVRDLLRQGPDHRKAATPAKTRRKTSSTPLVPSIESSSLPLKTATTRSTPQPAAPVAKQDGDPAAAPSKRRSPPGRPFRPGNREGAKVGRPLTNDQIRTITRQAMTQVSLRRLVRRLEKIAVTAPPREAIAASRMLLDLIGEGEVGRSGPPAPPQAAMIEIPLPPAR